MTVLALDTILAPITPEAALKATLEVAASRGLPVNAYAEGDNTLTVLEILAYWVSVHRAGSRTVVSAGWLDHAEDGTPLYETARETYGVTVIPQTYAGCVLQVTNTGDDTHPIGANDLSIENSSTGATYRNTSPAVGVIDILPGQTISFDILADVAGSAGSADVGDIDTVSSGQLGLECTNLTAAVGRDLEAGDALKARCRLKVPAISKTAAAPRGKYAYIAITPEENDGAAVTRADVDGNKTTGAVRVVLAGPSGAVSEEDRLKVETALVLYVIGPTETLTVVSATNVTIDVEYQLWIYDDVNQTDDEIRAAVSTRLSALFAIAPIGGWRKALDANGKVHHSLLEAVIKGVSSRAFDVAVAVPAGDEDLTETEVPVIGTVDGTITREPAPATGGAL